MQNTQNNISNNEQRPKLLIPKIDVVFHSLFRTHKEKLTSNFVSSLLQDKIKIIDMDKDRNLLKEYTDEKLGILDLRTELEGGTLCNVEIQLADKGNIIDRILYYWSRIFNQQLKTGAQYQELHKTIAILIIDFEIQELRGIDELGLKWKIMLDYHEKRLLTDKLEIVIIEIPKAKRILKNNQNNEIAQWMMFLDNPNSMEVSNIMEENDKIKEAMEELEKISQDESLRRIAELKEKYILDESSARRYYKEQGLAEGRAELKNVITNMLKNGLNKEQISSMTGMSIEKIEELSK